MSREIRRVPADWEHPKYNDYNGHQWQAGQYMRLYDNDYESASRQWIAEAIHAQFEYNPDAENIQRQRDHGCQNIHEVGFYWQCDPPPDPDSYRSRSWTDKEATHYQMYETVSEGTPVTPVFATLQELEDYMVDVGEMAGTEYNRKYSRESAKAFCKAGSSIGSMVVANGKVMDGVEALVEK